MKTFKISARNNQNSAAGYIARQIEQASYEGEPEAVELHAVGAQATYRAVRSAAKATEIMSSKGVDLICIPEFMPVILDGREQTGIRLTVKKF